MANFSNVLKSIIAERGITQDWIAKTAGVHPPTLNRYVNGVNKSPNVDILVKIANALNVSTDYLLGLTDVPNIKSETTAEERILLSAFRKASDRDIAVIWQLLETYLSPNEKDFLLQFVQTENNAKIG